MEPDGTRREALTLFEEHGAAVYRFALVLLRHREDAEDVLQETFLKLIGHLEAGRPDSNVRGWLFTVAAHACRDRMRRRTRWLPWSADHDAAVEPPALPDEDGRLRALRFAMGQLSKRDRLLVALRSQGLTYAQIAEASGVKPASVGRLLARALQRWERAYTTAPALPHALGRSSS
jgi:RNA polymerase sigma factor (sigma-70 family)